MGYFETSRYEFMLSLENGIDAAWRGTRSTLRNDIRRFERSGVVCCVRSDHGAMSALRDIDQETAIRHRMQGKPVTAMPEASFDALWHNLVNTGRVRIYLAEKNGIPIASVVVGQCGKNAYYLYGGATRDGLSINAPKGLLWCAIKNEYAQGIREFNLGGMAASAAEPNSIDHGLYKFKTGFGGIKRYCISGNLTLQPLLVKTLSMLHYAVDKISGDKMIKLPII